jgi:mannose-6-phosphate isomerase-like protein (cupin superfamily)
VQYFIIRNVGDLGPRVVASRDAEDVYAHNSAAHHEMTRMDVWSSDADPMQAEFGLLTLKAGERSEPIPANVVGYHVIASGSGVVDAGGPQVNVESGDCLTVEKISHSLTAGENGCVVASTSVPVPG